MPIKYYLYLEVCTRCGREDEKILIGESTPGWNFQLMVYDREIDNIPLNSWDNWKIVLKNQTIGNNDGYIALIRNDSYPTKLIVLDDLISIVEKRKNPNCSIERRRKPELDKINTTVTLIGLLSSKNAIKTGKETTWDLIKAENEPDL